MSCKTFAIMWLDIGNNKQNEVKLYLNKQI